MKSYKNFFLISLFIIASLFITSCSEDSTATDTPQEFIADDNSFSGWMNWTLEATEQGPDPALGAAHGGNDNTVERKIYFKDGQKIVNGKFPIGTIVAKHSKNPDGSVDMVTAMVKRGNNFNTTGGDWEWFVLDMDGKIMKDESDMEMRGAGLMNGMCVGCHSSASDKDFVFTEN